MNKYQKSLNRINLNTPNSDEGWSQEDRDHLLTVIEALEKQIPKKPIHIHKEYDKHDWYKNSDGTVDDFHWEYDIHSGVQCKRCGETVCTLCYDDYDEEAGECVIDCHRCPNCKRTVGKFKFCPDCGQKLSWESDT